MHLISWTHPRGSETGTKTRELVQRTAMRGEREGDSHEHFIIPGNAHGIQKVLGDLEASQFFCQAGQSTGQPIRREFST